jgi:hypothetical protein
MANKRCRFCFSQVEEGAFVCKVCKLDVNKDKKSLSKEEKKVWHAARNLYIIGFLAILGGVLGFISSLILLFTANNDAVQIGVILFYLALSVFGVLVGLSLRRFRRWAYVGGITLYAILIFLNILGGNIIGLVFSIVFLICIATSTSRKILFSEI